MENRIFSNFPKGKGKRKAGDDFRRPALFIFSDCFTLSHNVSYATYQKKARAHAINKKADVISNGCSRVVSRRDIFDSSKEPPSAS